MPSLAPRPPGCRREKEAPGRRRRHAGHTTAMPPAAICQCRASGITAEPAKPPSQGVLPRQLVRQAPASRDDLRVLRGLGLDRINPEAALDQEAATILQNFVEFAIAQLDD